jgi:hypothetical protein
MIHLVTGERKKVIKKQNITVIVLALIHPLNVFAGNVVTGLAATCATHFSAQNPVYNISANPLACYLTRVPATDWTLALNTFVYCFYLFLFPSKQLQKLSPSKSSFTTRTFGNY